jgi:xyloglucan-specific exo-beta-1,4-glucanase
MQKLILCLSLVLFSQFMSAQTWSPLPMYGGGFITDVVLHPTNPSVVVGVCDVGGIFISHDDCQTWSSLTANIPKTDYRNYQARSFAFDSTTPTTQYYVSGDAPWSSLPKIWKTTNSGSSWTSTSLPVNISGNNSARWAGSVLLVNPLTTNKLYIGGQPTFNYGTGNYDSDGGLITSSDGGVTWSKIGGTTFDKAWITKLRFAPSDPSVIYISAIIESMNGGSTVGSGLWKYNATTTVLTQLTTTEVLDFDIDAASASTIITTSASGNNVSTNGGSTWTPLSTPAGLTYGLFATAHPTQGNTWYFGTFSFFQNTIVSTTDGGATWLQVKYSSTHNTSKIVHPAYLATNDKPSFGNYMACLVIRSGVAYLSDWYGVWRTPNAALPLANTAAAATNNSNWTWTFLSQGIYNMVQVRTSLHPTDENRFFCNVADLHYYESTDAGATMNYSTVAPMNMTCRIDFHKNDPSVGYMCGSKEQGDMGKIFKTTNGGSSWSEIAAATFNGGAFNITDLQLTPSVGRIIVGIEKNSLPSQVYRSDNGGTTWVAWDNGLTASNVFKTWDKVDHLVKDADGETFYIWRDEKLFRRKLTDAAWTQLALPYPANWLSGVIAHPTNPQTLYIGQYTNTLYKSTNSGTTWTATTPLSSGSEVGTFAISKNGNIAVQTWNSNVQNLQISHNDGATWATMGMDGFTRLIDGLTFLKDTKLIGWSAGNSGFMATVSAPVLAVELLDFQGKAQHEGNLLSWQVADNQLFENFEIQKSKDGIAFDPLSILERKTRFFTDNNPFELTYYRLKINELNGTSTFSKTISIQNNAAVLSTKMRLYPNPVSDFLTVENDFLINEKIEIINVFGQVIKTFYGSKTVTQLDVSELTKGLYFLKNGDFCIRFIKK